MKFGMSLTCALFLALAVQCVNAAEPAKATTGELPAALRVLNADQGQILTTAEAGTIRGEGGWYFTNLSGMTFGPNFGIQNIGGTVQILGSKNVSIGSKNKFSVKAQFVGPYPYPF